MYGYGFRLQCRYSAHIQSTNVHICIDTIHCKIQKIFLYKKNNVCTLKSHFLRKKIGTGVFCTTNIHVIVSSHMSYMYMCYTYLSTFLRQRLPIFGWFFFALKNKISGKLKFQSKMCHIIQLNKSLFAIFRLYILYSMCIIYICIQSIKQKVLY